MVNKEHKKVISFNLRSAGVTIYEIFRFERPFKTHISFELIPVTPIDEFKEISDAVLFGWILF